MAAHPFTELEPEYKRLLQSMRITRTSEVDRTARDRLADLPYYKRVSQKLGIPAAFIAAIHMRESSGDFNTNLGQGDPLTRPSTHVPAGRPPLGAPPNNHFPVSWEYAAEDALTYDHVNDNSAPWSLAYAAWKGEIYNGFGPRNHGRYTGYLWAGTNVYNSGKYIADGQWDPDAQDKQLGIMPIIVRMIQLDPSLAFDQVPVPGPGPVPPIVSPPQPSPATVGGALTGTRWVQDSLNKIMAVDRAFAGYTPLAVDGSYGRSTREAVRQYQKVRELDQDGLLGPQTIAAIDSDLKTLLNNPIIQVDPPKLPVTPPKPVIIVKPDATWGIITVIINYLSSLFYKPVAPPAPPKPVIPPKPVDPPAPIDPPKPAVIVKPDALGLRLKRTCLALGYQWFDDQNVISVEGMDPDGTPNKNRPNAFDDVKMIIDGDGKIIGGPWEGTTQPGKFWTAHPMAQGGAFIIALGQQTCWTPGEYHDRIVWRQAEDSHILGFRDKLKNYTRQGQPILHGNIGVHHHGGYDLPRDDIANAAAGCQVIRLWKYQAEFMDITLRCQRYLANKSDFRLTAVVLRSEDILK